MNHDIDIPPVDPDELGPEWNETIQEERLPKEPEQPESRRWFQPEARPCAFHEHGEFGADYGIYSECSSLTCGLHDNCRREHDDKATAGREALYGFPHYLTIPIGLLTDRELKPLEYLIISLVHYRCQKFDHCTDTNRMLTALFGVSK